MKRVCVAFKAHMGWINAVAVDSGSKTPRAVRVDRLDLVDADDREALEPYHVAGGWHHLSRVTPPSDPAGVIRRGRRKQVSAAKKRMKRYAAALAKDRLEWRRGVMLTARGWLGDDLERILGSHAHVHVAEGEAIRDSTRSALDALGVVWVDQDEKSVSEEVRRKLGCSDADLDELAKAARPAETRSWRQEERRIALAAWLHRR